MAAIDIVKTMLSICLLKVILICNGINKVILPLRPMIISTSNYLAYYAVKCSEDGETPIPFNEDDYIMAGTMDYADTSLLSDDEGFETVENKKKGKSQGRKKDVVKKQDMEVETEVGVKIETGRLLSMKT
ncbi:hypothetical protein DPMN_045666 [Dreissena polymorpha]|uniref:Uncharacterized protein n=1 Tax=Dreissena polymorpha TaxID=45954 RepID=A0A9D4D5B9_DREPO|nr:hypothetical protein DPMN_045666 [Dreissena polymorpha]